MILSLASLRDWSWNLEPVQWTQHNLKYWSPARQPDCIKFTVKKDKSITEKRKIIQHQKRSEIINAHCERAEWNPDAVPLWQIPDRMVVGKSRRWRPKYHRSHFTKMNEEKKWVKIWSAQQSPSKRLWGHDCEWSKKRERRRKDTDIRRWESMVTPNGTTAHI